MNIILIQTCPCFFHDGLKILTEMKKNLTSCFINCFCFIRMCLMSQSIFNYFAGYINEIYEYSRAITISIVRLEALARNCPLDFNIIIKKENKSGGIQYKVYYII